MKYPSINQDLFTGNRARFAARMEPGSMAIFHSNDEMPRSADQFHPFRQHPDLFYLSGIDQEETLLLLFPDCPLPEYREVLFLRQTNETIAVWEGHKYTKDEARLASGIPTVLWTEDLEGIFHMLMVYCRKVYLDLNENYRTKYILPDRNHRMALQLKERFPAHDYLRSAPIMLELRQIKSGIETELLREAIRITGNAFRRLMKFIKPGVTEYQVEAEILHEFLFHRASGYGYYPIVASGANSCVLHYVANNQECLDGEILLLDFGAEYANYSADLTRTIPVNGRFSPRQRAVYDAVLRVMKQAMKMLRPGTIIYKYNDEVGQLMEEELIGLGLLKREEVARQDPMKPLYKKYFMHGTSHHLGLDVHDLGTRFEAIQPGMVFTCEPGIYIPEEKIGIRIENDVLITANDPVDLMQSIPVEADEIEELMRR